MKKTIAGKVKIKKAEIPGKESWRDLSITKTCDACGKKYHPRNNSYQYTSRFCSQECARQARKRKIFHPLGLSVPPPAKKS